MTPLRIFIGWDAKEIAAYHTLCHSIIRHASGPVSITPLVRSQLGKVLTRERGPLESTDFSISRFLVPYLSGYEGVSVYMDCDMLCLGDVHDLMDGPPVMPWKAVWCVQHEYEPKTKTKMDGQIQTSYPRKNWSSLMVFNNSGCMALTPEYVNTAQASSLHRMDWARSVGSLPLEWNWLVGEYPKNPDAKILHYTLGGPWMRGYEACDHAEDWYAERNLILGEAAKACLEPIR